MHKPKSIEELVRSQLHRSQITVEPGEVVKPCTGPVVTISRSMGSGARIIAQKLAEDIGWAVWDKELLDQVAENAHIRQEIVESFDEKRRSELELLVEAVLGNPVPDGFLYNKHLARVILEIACTGNSIFIGRGANFLLPKALNIRIDAPFAIRVSNMMEFESLSHEEAEAKIKASDKERKRFLVSTYGKDRVANFNYDISLWMEKLTNEDAVNVIKALLAGCK